MRNRIPQIRLNPDYEKLLNKANELGYTLPDAKTQQLGMRLIQEMKAAGVWSKLDVFYVFATSADCSNFATLNWKNPAAHQCTLQNSPIFTAKQGFKGNRSNMWIDTNYNPSTQGTNYELNNASYGCWIYTTFTSGTNIPMGALPTYIIAAGSTYQIINSSGSENLNSAADLAGTGHTVINRVDANNVILFKNKTKIERTRTSSLVPNATFKLISYTGLNNYSDFELSMAFAGASLVSENDAFVDAFTKYLTSL